MANDSAEPIRHRSSHTDRYVKEIDDIFLKHGETLDDERQVAIDQIDKWCSDWTTYINNHAAQQKHLLNDAYIRQRRVFDKKHDENLETADAYNVMKQKDLFNQLRDVCRSLKFQIATLQFSKYEMERPEVIIIEEQMESKTPQETNINDRDDARRRRRLNNKKDENKAENNNGVRVSSPPHSITSNTAQASDQQSLTTKTKINNGPLTDNNDDSNNKCPICFMIFPISMTRNDRHQHANAHIEDD